MLFRSIPARCTHGANAPGGGGKDPYACKWGQLVDPRNGGEGAWGVRGGGRGVESSVSCARECTGYPRGTWHSLSLEEDALQHLLHHSLITQVSFVQVCN